MIKIKSVQNMSYGYFPELNSRHLVSGISLKNQNHHFNMAIHTGAHINDAFMTRKKFFHLFRINYKHLVTVRQTHSDLFYVASDKDKQLGTTTEFQQLPEADAIITTEKNLPIALFTADCMPLFVYIKTMPLIALIHAGWHGSQKRIIYKTLQYIISHYSVSPENIIIAPGPTILQCCYSVSDDFSQFFNKKYLIFENKTLYFNLYESNLDQVRELGVPERNIIDSQFCTMCHSNVCHSYRQNKTMYRMTSFMMLR